ncbi:putative quinol monooxygenase [Salinispora fenicalii]|uniref:putative quinol monooxygenase n=1 Tax=Salinispora fenicalii TaxID=1137263 RepID=UPI0004781F46|nr:putative quinol monooxygenase [Salinispora fenicalii]
MSRLTIVANVHAKSGQVDLVKAELKKLIPLTRAEKGCINFDLHQDNNDPAHFFLYENWESREIWEVHKGAAHLQEYMDATAGKIDEYNFTDMTQIE